ncbi:MAG: ATP-binding protein [Vicinamibacterales bacterium]
MLRHVSLRARVLFAGLLALALSAAAGYTAYERAQDAAVATAARESTFAAGAATSAVSFMADHLHSLLVGTAAADAVRHAESDPDACLARLEVAAAGEREAGLISNLFVLAGDGRALCQLVPGPIPVTDPEGRPYEWADVRPGPGERLRTSNPFYGALSKRWIVVASIPRGGPDDGVVGASIDLEALNESIVAAASRTRDVLVTLATADGDTLARSLDFAGAVGKPVPTSPTVRGAESDTVFGAPVTRRADGTLELLQTEPVLAPDREGLTRAWVTRLASPLPWVVHVGVLVDDSTSGLVSRTLGVAPVVTALFVVLAVVLLLTVSRELGGLVEGVRRAPIDGPDVIPVGGSPEVADLGRALRSAFDDRLRAEATLTAANRVLEARVAERSAELQRQADALAAANAELVEANRVKDHFLSAITHELQTPLKTMVGVTESLREGVYGSLSAQQRTALDQSRDAAAQLLALVTDVLDYTRLQAGRLVLAREPVGIGDLVRAAAEAARPLAQAKQLAFVAPPVPPELRVPGDAARLRQALVNLVVNAMKVSRAGQSIGIDVRTDARGWVELVVWDNGIGIPDSQREAVFEPFGQASSGSGGRAAGLALALSRAIVDAHGGSITVESAVGIGSRFTVALPLSIAD